MAIKRKYKYTKKTGRPAKYTEVEVMEAKIQAYFDDCPDKRQSVFEGVILNIPCPTVTGLALYLGFVNRGSMYDYAKDGKFSNTIKKAIARIERVYESMLHGSSPTGAIFALKNFGWADKQIVATGDLSDNKFRDEFFGITTGKTGDKDD